MRRRLLVAAGLLLALGGTALSAGGAYAYYWDSAHADRIARGVQIAGVEVGGLEAADARARLRAALGARLSRPARLVYGSHRFTIRPQGAGLTVDVDRMVADAVRLSRSGGLAHRLLRDVRGDRLHASVPLSAALSAERLSTVAAHVARVLDRPAHDAQIVP